MTKRRKTAVSGLFYPSEKAELERQIKSLLEGPIPASDSITKGVIVPHAGYIYSGPIAASLYRQLTPLKKSIRRVILLGPSHYFPIRGLALPDVDEFETPLGSVGIDKELCQKALELSQVSISAPAHSKEHSLEVQLPFLQTVFENFKIVPFAVGDATPEEVAQVLEAVWGGRETLIVISSDLSHYLTYDEARKIDSTTAQSILDQTILKDWNQACGSIPINGFLLAARKHDLTSKLVDMRNSGDTAGDRTRVVGYASFSFEESQA